MGCFASRNTCSYADCVRAVAGRMTESATINKHDAARLLVFFDAPANVVARATCSNYVATHELEWRSVAKRLLSCADTAQASVMAPMVTPIYRGDFDRNGIYFRDV